MASARYLSERRWSAGVRAMGFLRAEEEGTEECCEAEVEVEVEVEVEEEEGLAERTDLAEDWGRPSLEDRESGRSKEESRRCQWGGGSRQGTGY